MSTFDPIGMALRLARYDREISARDELEQTQDIPGRTVAGEYHTNGVFRIDRSAGYPCHRYAPELSMEQHR